MKLKPTFFGAIAAKKKPLFSVLALALLAGVIPALIANTHADVYIGEDLVDPEEITTVYTTVGPDYFTYVDIYPTDGETIRIADTSIADFYIYNSSSSVAEERENLAQQPASREAPSQHGPIYPYWCDYDYLCIQGKTIGTTEILIEKEDEETIHIPLVSVKLSPDAYNIVNNGATITGAGSIEGADNSLLELVEVGSRDNTVAVKTGDRSFSVVVPEDAPMYGNSAYLLWKIGDQYVGGGTFYSSLNVNAVDNVSHSEDNETILENSLMNIYKKLYSMRAIIYDESEFSVTADDGTVMRFIRPDQSLPVYSEPSNIEITLDPADEYISEVTKDELASKLPEGASGIKFTTIKTNVSTCYVYSHGGDINLYSYPIQNGVLMDDDTDIICIRDGEFTRLGQNLDLSIPVTDAKELKNGYTRKWYVAKIDNGVVETIDTTYDETTKSIRFTSNSFGFYAYGYIDEKNPDQDTPSQDSKVPKVPNSGVGPKQ